MRAIAAPIRFLIVVTGVWMCGRAVFLLSEREVLSVGGMVPPAMKNAAKTTLPAPAAGLTLPLVEPRAAVVTAVPAADERRKQWRLAAYEVIPAPPPAVPQPAGPQPAPTEMVLPGAPTSRWTGSTWLFARPDRGRSALASGGQLGGSQAGARLAYRLADQGPLAVAGRISTPLRETRGAEGAVGLDWHPVAALPFRLSVERRIALGNDGRNAWSAYAAGGFYRAGLAGGLEIDGYGQGGVVGARSRDLFIDGALRIGRPIALSEGKRMVVGAGIWGAAQPGASRVDIGPRAALSLPLAGTTVTGSVDWRIRVAGDAAPGSGVALTLAADF